MTLDALFKKLEKDIRSSLAAETAGAVKDEMRQAIQGTVYDAYAPRYYRRRMEQGGLIDSSNIQSSIDGDTLTVRDTAPLDNGRADYALDDLIVNGLGNMPFPRDFYGDTAEQLRQDGAHVQAMREGLKKRGWKVK